MSRDDSMKTLKKVMTFIGRYKALLVLSIVLAALSVVLQLYIPILFGNAIDGIIAKGKVDFGIIGYYLIRILIMVLIAGIATFVMNLINNRLTYRVVQDIRSKAIRKIQVLPLSYLDTKETGDIVSCVIADVDQVSDGLLLGLTQLFWRRYDYHDACLHVHEEPADYPSRHRPDTAFILRGKVHRKPFLQYVPQDV